MISALVISGTGQVGFALRRHLRQKNIDVHFTYYRNHVTSNHPKAHYMNLGDTRSCLELIKQLGPKVIYIVSGMTSADECEKNQESAFLFNVETPVAIAREAHKMGIKVVYFSSAFVFDGTKSDYTEADATKPISVYGKTKAEAEQSILDITEDNALIIRTIVVFGEDPRKKNFFSQVHASLSQNLSMTVPKDQISNPIWNEDLAKGCALLVEADASGIYHVAGDEALDRYEFAKKIAKEFSLDLDLIKPRLTNEIAYLAMRPLNTVLNTQKIRVCLPRWQPTSLNKALQNLHKLVEINNHDEK